MREGNEGGGGDNRRRRDEAGREIVFKGMLSVMVCVVSGSNIEWKHL